MIFGVVTLACSPGSDVQPVGQRVEHLRVVEALRGGQVPLLAGDRVEVGERFGQPAEFGLQDHLHLVVGQAAGAPVHPVGQLHGDVQGLVIARQLVLVDHPGQVLVDHVVRRPDRLSLLQPVEVDLGERGQVAGMEPGRGGPGLERGQLADQVAAAGSGGLVVGVGVGQREAGQQVPGHVAADLRVRLLPAAERLGRRGQAVVQAEGAQHPFGVEEQQVRGVPGLVVAERAVEQADVLQWQRGGAARGAVGRVAAGLRRDAGSGGEGWRSAGSRRRPGPVRRSARRRRRQARSGPAACSGRPGRFCGGALGALAVWGGFVPGALWGALAVWGGLSPGAPLRVGTPAALFTPEILCPVSTSRKIVPSDTYPCNRPA